MGSGEWGINYSPPVTVAVVASVAVGGKLFHHQQPHLLRKL
ncbi:MAG: hypothetical protein V7L05_02815 [Nostoc sp.]